MTSILVFPAGMPTAIAFAYEASNRGRRVVGASSLQHDCEREQYSEFARLPWVLEDEFPHALADLVFRYEVGEIYCPHPVVWDRLNTLLPSLPRPVTLHAQDWGRELAGYARRRQMAAAYSTRSWQTFFGATIRPPLAEAQVAGLIRLFEITPGQCAHTKLEALISLFRDLPDGDIVEIGSLFGRTALVFSFLARQYQTGKVLCVDPWSSAEKVQDSKAVDEQAKSVPIEDIFSAFAANLAPWCGTVNYIRKTSVQGAVDYGSGKPVHTCEFGVTRCCGHISLLHLDGNHAFQFIQNDVLAWAAFVRKEGWIIFDDYRWHFGDGPRLVADDFCERFRNYWSLAFEVGGALFVRLSQPIPASLLKSAYSA